MNLFAKVVTTTLVFGAVSASANMITIDFENQAQSTAVTTIGYAGGLFTVSDVRKQTSSNGIKTSEAWVYDTNNANGRDPDLTASFANVLDPQATALNPGNVLIVQENLNKTADDNGLGGSMRFDFGPSVWLNSIDVFDVKKEAVTFKLYNSLDALLMTVVNTANSDTGNNKTNNKYETVGFGDVEVAWLTVDFRDSGALDNVRFSTEDASIASVPLPGAVWLFATALAGLAGVRARKAKQDC